MKKIIGILLFLVAFVFSADVKPFYFENVDSINQQATWDELMKYKLWGTESFKIGGNSKIPDESGRNGTTGNLTGTGNETLLGGPIHVNGDISLGNGYTFPTGPTVANSMTINSLNNGYFGGTLCLADTNVSDKIKQGLVKGGGELSNDCEGYPKLTGLTIPSITWPDSTLHDLTVDMHQTGYIEVPEGEGPYDIYLSGITMDQESKLYIDIPDTGRLVRIFVNGEINLSNHAVIQTMNNGLPIPNDEYMGNLLFYTTEDLTFDNTDYCIRQGTYISAKTFYLKQQVTFAGQLLANNLYIGENVDGKNFLFVSFDNPVINLGDPKTNALGNFLENNKNVAIPIYLDTLAPVKVSFNYCFILNDNATLADFNIESAPIPVCDVGEGKVTIAEGTSTPVDPVYVNVIDDGIIEGTEVVGLKIYNVSGASLPGNKRTHVFTLTLSDSDLFKINTDSIAKSVPENKKDTILGKIELLGKSDTSVIKLSDKDTSKFELNPVTGEVKLKVEYDYEKQQKENITIIAIDGSKSDTVNFDIDILDVNEEPLVEKQTFVLDENKKGYVGTIIWTDTDSLTKDFQINECVLVSTSDTSYHVVDGKITTSKVHDYETEKEPVIIIVKIKDKKDTSLYVIDTMTVKITNVKEGIKTTYHVDPVSEFADIGTFVGVVDAKDSDNVDVKYSTKSTDFKIDPVTGVITVNTLLDYEKTNSYDIKVYIDSDDGNKDSTVVTIKITDENEAPILLPSDLNINEDTTGTAGIIKHDDPDKKNPVFNVEKFTIIAGDTTKFKLDSNKVIVKTPIDFDKGDSVFYITVKVSDKNDTTLFDTLTYKINVKPVNENPKVLIPEIVIKENCPSDSCADSTFTNKFPVNAVDPDHDTLTYEIDNENFKIDSNGVISVVKPLDHEKDSVIVATIYVSDGKVTIATDVIIHIEDVNEPVHVTSEPIDVKENYTGPVGKVEGKDDDGDKISYWVSDSTKYTIDDNGNISINVPYDFETFDGKQIDKDTKLDSIIVFVTDGRGDTATTVVKINVKNEKETSNVQIVHVDTRDSVYTETDKPIYTNDKDIEITYKTDDKHKDTTITGLKEGENKIEICDISEGKDTKSCDTVIVWYSNKTPIITVATIDKNKSNVNNITIIDEPDGNQYVNSKNPEIKVTVKDPTNAKKDTTFNINVDLKTVDVPVKSLTNKTIEPIIGDIVPMGMENYKYETVGKDSVRISYYDPIVKATISYIVNEKEERINDEFTVSYIEKVNGQDITISYTTDSYVEVKSNYSISYSVPQGKDTITVSYQVNSEGKIQKTNGNVGYTISYSYTNEYGNTGTSEIQVILDDVPPKVEIYKLIAGKDTLYPGEGKNWTEYVKSSSIIVFWTVDGKDQDTLTLQGLKAEKINSIVRCYQDKANNQTCDTVNVYAKGAKEIEIKIAHPVTEIDKDRVDSFYNEGGKYNPKKPIQIIAQDASEDKLPEPVGVGIKIGLALPILNQNGGMPTADDIVQTIDGVTGIVIDGNGNVVTDAIAEIRDNSTKIISVDNYIENYCTDQYKEEVRKNGIEKVPFYDMKYSMHVWIFNNNAEYVNDFNFEYTIDENQKVDASGMLNLMVDWLAAKDGYVKAKNNKAIGTGAYLTKLEAKSISTAKCTLNADTKKGTKIKKTEYDLTSFGYKRPIKK